MKLNIKDETIKLATKWQDEANAAATKQDRAYQQLIASMINEPNDRFTFTELLDRSLRPNNSSTVAKHIKKIFKLQRVPKFMSWHEKLLIKGFTLLSFLAPSIAVPIFIKKIRLETKDLIVDAHTPLLEKFIKQKSKYKYLRHNFNLIGEAALGQEATHLWIDKYIKLLKNSKIEYISVKASTLYSQLNSISTEHSVKKLVEQLSTLYQIASTHFYVNHKGEKKPKFVNIDMEEYKELEISYRAFMETLSKDEFKNLSAGIALQAYLPESYTILQHITIWAKQRFSQGGSPIKIRIVKGANMSMEKIESELYHWDNPILPDKISTDANYKRMLNYALNLENTVAANIGIASHNLFDIAYAYLIGTQNSSLPNCNFEMLIGMTGSYTRILPKYVGSILLYTPIVHDKNFTNAVAYLVRRLDESTSEDNFLYYSFNLTTDSPEWKFLADTFSRSLDLIPEIPIHPLRTQDRTISPKMDDLNIINQFIPEHDTDFSLPQNRKWANDIKSKWQYCEAIHVYPVVAGKTYDNLSKKNILTMQDPSNPSRTVAYYHNATAELVDHAVKTAQNDPDNWRLKNLQERKLIFIKIAKHLQIIRGDLIGAAAAANGKTFIETDVEVSEAIDFVNYYIHSLAKWSSLFAHISPVGVVAVIPPWNFPVAIPTGGVAAALASGNRVILKPSDSASLTSSLLCQAFWDAGVPKTALQLLPATVDTGIPQLLTSHQDINAIIFTGSTNTGRTIIQSTPNAKIYAETGGKNSTIVTDTADKDLAIKNIIHSAFSNCGQKCSATSLLILLKDVYEDREFQNSLVDAAKSLNVGNVWDFSNKLGPLNSPLSSKQQKLLNDELSNGEYWVLPPKKLSKEVNIYSPAIKYGVREGSYDHQTEFFLPVLAVMRAENLEHAIKIANSTPFGLTAGLESLDLDEQQDWMQNIHVGNLYINRPTTGAVVLRQPFGGIKDSALGAGIKCGGPNYVIQFSNLDAPNKQKFDNLLIPKQLYEIQALFEQQDLDILKSYHHAWETHFGKEIDYFNIVGQHNLCRYVPLSNFNKQVVLIVHNCDIERDILLRALAATITKNNVIISYNKDIPKPLFNFINKMITYPFFNKIKLLQQNDDDLADIIKFSLFRYSHPEHVSKFILQTAIKDSIYIAKSPVSSIGRLELLHYMEEQSISINYHRYGNLGREAPK